MFQTYIALVAPASAAAASTELWKHTASCVAVTLFAYCCR